MIQEQTRRERYEAHLRSPLWTKQRLDAFARWGRFCGCCGADNAVHVHHLNYRNLIDCTPEDFMPLCEACHDRVHATPALDQMARIVGDPMKKRRMVILRLRAEVEKFVQIVRVVEGPKLESKRERNRLKKERKRLKKLERLQSLENKIEDAFIAALKCDQTEDKKARKFLLRQKRHDEVGPHPNVLKILASRFQVPEETFHGWPGSTINAILLRQAIPIFAKPLLAPEIARTSPDELITLTRADIKALRTDKNAFTRFTIEALGMKWNELKAGWCGELVGKTMPKSQYLRALAGKSIYAGAARGIAI